MKSKLVLASAVAAIGLGACQLGWQTYAGGSPVASACSQDEAQYCHGNQCDLRVTVASCSAASINVTPSDLHLCQGRHAKTLNWILPAGGPYAFRDDGVDFKNLPDHDDFDPATKRKGPFKYSWDDKLKHGGGRQFDYAIRIQGPDGSCDKDPRITND